MNITFKLYASLGDYLPAESKGHSINLNADSTATAYQIIERFKIPRNLAHLVLLNGRYLAPNERDEANLKEGDTLAVWPPVAGG